MTMFVPTKEERIRRRFIKRLSAIDDVVREDARKAVEIAAKQALQAARNGDNRSLYYFASENESPLARPSDHSHSSFLSRERAMRRGSKRGIFETNEIDNNSWKHSIESSQDHDQTLATATETRNTGQSDHKNRRFKFILRMRKTSNSSLKKNLTAEISKEAWMCGVCAKSFSSFEAAEKHEEYHIREIVTDLGWAHNSSINDSQAGTPNAANFLVSQFASPDPLRTPAATNNLRTLIPNLGASQPRPDVLRMSTPALSSRLGFHPEFTPALQRKKLPAQPLNSDGFQTSDFDAPEEYGLATSIMRAVPPIMTPIVQNRDGYNENDLMLPREMKDHIVLADEGLVDVCNKATPLILTAGEAEAEFELRWLARDKAYYDQLSHRQIERQQDGRYIKYRKEGRTILSKAHNKCLDAYKLMKEGKSKRGNMSMDHYTRKLKGDSEISHVIQHSTKTLYMNVIVKNSLKVVSNELERLAKIKWADDQSTKSGETDIERQRFEQFRAAAQVNLVKLAGLALASDFTPRRIAIQLSNDFYRLLTPKLKKRGVSIETEIEYRVGPYFVLAINFGKIDWRRLVKSANRDVAERRSRWERDRDTEDTEKASQRARNLVSLFLFGSRDEVLAQFLALLYYFHWIFYTPICFVLYHVFLGQTFRSYFLSSVADEIFFYVEQKGMEMEVGIRDSSTQAAFMLSALREVRADGRELKKKQQEGESASKGTILGPLLGPAITDDKKPAPSMPAGFTMPENLEFIGLELDLPVGFKRLRWAFLYSKGTFVTDAIFREEAKYDNITVGTWTKHDDVIGLPTIPGGVKEEDLIGAEKEMSYLMPKSAFVSANMCTETAYIEAYNDYCFVMKKKALTPGVPYGSTFVAWTKFVVINTGSNSCKMICSVEAEFPNGPPMVARQIKSGMRTGVGELFVKIGETITKYTDEFP